MIDIDFIFTFKQRTEDRWRQQVINQTLYGFQFQKGTRWNPGLSETQINQYEKELGFSLPPDLRLFLACLNGTDLPTLNVYGNSGEPHRTSVGVNTYPSDLDRVKQRISDIAGEWNDINAVLAEVGFEGSNESLFPFYIHRYVICGPSFLDSPVLSIYGNDVIVYAPSFREYLEAEFLRDG